MHGIHANMTDKEVCTGHIHRAYPQYDLWPAKLSSDLFCLAQGRDWLSLNWHSFKEDVIGLDWHSSSGRGTCALGEVENMLIAGSRWKRVAQLETANVEQGWTFRKRGDRGGGRRRLCWGGLLGSGERLRSRFDALCPERPEVQAGFTGSGAAEVPSGLDSRPATARTTARAVDGLAPAQQRRRPGAAELRCGSWLARSDAGFRILSPPPATRRRT